jgi:hypothetical protein
MARWNALPCLDEDLDGLFGYCSHDPRLSRELKESQSGSCFELCEYVDIQRLELRNSASRNETPRDLGFGGKLTEVIGAIRVMDVENTE